MEGDGMETPVASVATGGRACDTCRARKIRCDRTSPCSNCRISKVQCQISPKVNEHRQRILISSRYEKQVESIEERLVGIENSLRTLVVESKKGASPATGTKISSFTPKHTQKLVLEPLSDHSPRPDTEDSFEGDTSLLAHSLHAKGIFEKLSSGLLSSQNPCLKNALTELQKTLRSENEPIALYDMRFTSESTEVSSSELELPPMKSVIDLLRLCNEKTFRMFLEWPIIEQSNFTEKCRQVYFCTIDVSPARLIIVNLGLYYLFMEHSFSLSGNDASEARRYASLCRYNFERTIEKVHLLIAPSLEACQALLLGAFFAGEFAKPSLCFRLTVIAAQMSQDLGYHRLPGTEIESSQFQEKKLAFWGIHALDKALSLRLGRTSIIQDCDISTPMPAYPTDPTHHPWHEMSLIWIGLAKFQGRVFSELFTVAALSLAPAMRADRAQKLAAELQEWREKEAKVSMCEDTLYPEDFRMSLDSLDVLCFGILTIIYRAIPPDPNNGSLIFYSECVASARKALELHQLAALRFKASDDMWKGYIYWTLLYTPFAPFMVVFCEAIATFNHVDLHHLEEFVSSIRPTIGDSEAAVRLYNLCSAFFEVTQVYFAESATSGGGSSSGVLPNDPLVPPGSENSFLGQTPETDAYMAWPAEDWFLPDQYMMGILDPSLRIS